MTDQIIYPPNPLTWQATVLQIHDGDTVTLDVDLKQKVRHKDADLGFHIHITSNSLRLHHPTRLYGINAPELATNAGQASATALKSWLPLGTQVTLRTWLNQADKYGRLLGAISLADGSDLNQRMVDSGNAAIYYGTGPKPVPA